MEKSDRGNMEADLSKPMTTEQATTKHECQECKRGGNCDYDCVLSATCSLRCTHCNARSWFDGDLPFDQPWTFVCVKCGSKTTMPSAIQRGIT